MLRKIILTILLTTSNSALADNYIEHTDQRPTIGCYKTNGSDLCVSIAYIHCGKIPTGPEDQRIALRNAQREANAVKYGDIVASLCDDLGYLSEQALGDSTRIKRLKHKVRKLEAKLRG